MDVAVGQRDSRPIDRADRRTVAEVCAHAGGLLDEIGVEPRALGHDRERRVIAMLKLPGPFVADAEGGDRPLGDGSEREREQLDGRDQYAAAAGLVAREQCAVEQQHVHAGAGEVVGGGRSTWAGPDDYGVPASDHRVQALSTTVLSAAAIGAAKQKMIASIGSPKAIARKGNGAATSRMPSSAMRVTR